MYFHPKFEYEIEDNEDLEKFETDVAYLRISKVSIYISSPQGLVRYPGLFDIDYHFKLKELFVCLFKNLNIYVIKLKLEIDRA